jgi:hypothetical protein
MVVVCGGDWTSRRASGISGRSSRRISSGGMDLAGSHVVSDGLPRSPARNPALALLLRASPFAPASGSLDCWRGARSLDRLRCSCSSTVSRRLARYGRLVGGSTVYPEPCVGAWIDERNGQGVRSHLHSMVVCGARSSGTGAGLYGVNSRLEHTCFVRDSRRVTGGPVLLGAALAHGLHLNSKHP